MPKLSKWNRRLLWGAFLVLAVFIALVANSLFSLSLNSRDMLQSMIQAEATVLGFFGIIASYLWASFDSRIDRLDQQIFDSELENKPRFDRLTKNLKTISAKKADLVENSAILGFVLISSLLCSITTLGLLDSQMTQSAGLGVVGFMLFLTGIVGFFLMLLRVSKEH